jgi:hypothetical protein
MADDLNALFAKLIREGHASSPKATRSRSTPAPNPRDWQIVLFEVFIESVDCLNCFDERSRHFRAARVFITRQGPSGARISQIANYREAKALHEQNPQVPWHRLVRTGSNPFCPLCAPDEFAGASHTICGKLPDTLPEMACDPRPAPHNFSSTSAELSELPDATA